MRRSAVLIGAIALIVLTGVMAAQGQEEAVPPDKIPKAVMTALLAKFPKAKIDKCTKAKEGDDVVYDIEFKENGRKCEADIKEDGTIINIEDMTPHTQTPHGAKRPAKYALEANRGWFSKRAIQAGAKVQGLERAPPAR